MAMEESFDDLEEWIDSVKPKILAESFEAQYERKSKPRERGRGFEQMERNLRI